MSSRDDVDEPFAGDLYRAYRSSLEVTPYSATDQTILDTAAYDGSFRRSPGRIYVALGVLIATLGLVLALTLLPSNRQGAADEGQISSYGDYSVDAVLGPAYTQQNELEQATVALQFNAESQYAALVMQAAATQSDLHAVTLELLRIQPTLGRRVPAASSFTKIPSPR